MYQPSKCTYIHIHIHIYIYIHHVKGGTDRSRSSGPCKKNKNKNKTPRIWTAISYKNFLQLATITETPPLFFIFLWPIGKQRHAAAGYFETAKKILLGGGVLRCAAWSAYISGTTCACGMYGNLDNETVKILLWCCWVGMP